LHPAHSLCFIHRSLNCFNGRIGIHDHTFAEAARFGFANADDLQQSSCAGFANETSHFARPDVQTHSVILSPCHSISFSVIPLS